MDNNDNTKDDRHLLEWWNNKSINPLTNRFIKSKGYTWKKFLKSTLKKNVINDNYDSFHGKLIDPIMKNEIKNKRNLYSYKFCWNPLNGSILGIDPRGPLYFDPDILLHYFYINRVRYLWYKENNNYSARYGDAMGNGPEFNIKGRGSHHHWYLFRLPLFDAYCNKIDQQTTIAPILTLKDIKKIYRLSLKRKKNYYKCFGRERPNLIKIYELYHQAISKPDYEDINLKGFPKEIIKENYNVININAVNQLTLL